MSYNRSLLSQITKDLNKKPSKPKVPKNQWQHPGEITNIPSNNITMDAVSYPVLGVPNVGQPQMMYPDQQYHYPDANNVTEYPMMQGGGEMIRRADGSYSRRGLWDNIRANKGSGKKPTKRMLEQERKIKSKMQFGGLWDSNRVAWVDSVNNANMDKNFVQRMYNPNAPQMFLPGDKRPSTHFMESGDGRAYPTVVQRPGNKYVEWLNQRDPRAAYNYAMDTGQYIQFPNDTQATWYGANGYKQGTNVVTGKKKMQPGGENNPDQLFANAAKSALGFLGDVVSFPARAVVKGITGKYQDPSQAFGISNPIGAFLTDAILDPTNLVGAGLAAKVLKGAGKANKVAKVIEVADRIANTNTLQRMTAAPKNIPIDPADFNKASKATIDALTQRGQQLDKITGGLLNISPDDIHYHGTYSGRPIVQVNTPNGPEYFYKSTGWGGKDAGQGTWQVYGQHMDAPGVADNWFVKGQDYKNWYGSQAFRNTANNLDNLIMQKYGVPQQDVNKLLNFQNIQGNVNTFVPKKQYGGAMKKYQKAGQVIKPKNGFINLKDYGYQEFTPEFMAKAEELNKLYPGTQFQCTANGCADIATKVAGAYGHNFGRFNAWDAGNQNPVAFINPSYTEQMLTGKEPLPNPKSYTVPTQMQGMENKIITMNRNNNLVDAKGNKLKINPQNILLGKSPYVKGSNDSFDYKYNYLKSRGMEHAGYLKGNKTLIHGTAANKEHPAFFIFDDLADGIKLPGYGRYEAVEAIDEPSALLRNWNDVANGFGAVKQNVVDLFTAATNPADIIKEGTNLYNKYTKTNKKGNIARSNPASIIPSFIPNVSQVPRIFNKGINFAERSLDKARRAIPVGESIIDYLGNQGVKYDKATRRAIANHLGIKDYNFSADKNIELMKRIAQAPEILDRFVHPKAQFGGVGMPNFSALLPSNIQTFGKYVGSALGINADPIVQKNDFTKENLRAIYNAAQAAKKRTGSNHGGTKYVDYGQSYNNIWNKGVPEILKGNSIVQKVGKLPFRAFNMIKDTMLDPTYQAATSTGRFTYDINPDGSVRVKDNYDFDQESDGIFNAIDNMLGKKDYRRNIGFTINPKDIKRQGGLIKAQTLGEFKGVNTQPLTGAPASAWATGWSDNTTTDPYKVQQTGFVVNQQQATNPVKADNAHITPQWAVKANNFLNKVEKVDDFVSDFGDGVFNAFNVFAQKTAMGNQSDREEANRQMLRAQNASWNQQYNDTMNRGNFSQGPSSYGMFKPNQTFAQQGIEVPVSMDTVSKYTVDSFDEAAGINTIGIGAPEFDFSSMRAQPNDMSVSQEAPEQAESSYEAPEGNLREIIAQRESLGNYQALPRRKDGTLASSAAGKYQFLWDTHKDTIRTVTGVNSKSQFLNSPKAQEAYFDYWDQNVLTPKAQKIKQQYNPSLDTNQIKMLIHFQGPEGAEKYIRTGKYTKDAFGTTPMSYLTKNISTKKGVSTENLESNLKSFASSMSDRFPGLKISSANDSKHMRGSKHYANKAIDIGANSSNPVAYNRLANFLAQNPGIKKQYGIEDIINEGDHLHIETMQQGGEYELTADQIMQIKAMGGDVEFI